jgi:hypothetical protein
MRSTALVSTGLCVALLVAIASSACAVPRGFTTDFGDACKEARDTGKLIFCFYHLTG